VVPSNANSAHFVPPQDGYITRVDVRMSGEGPAVGGAPVWSKLSPGLSYSNPSEVMGAPTYNGDVANYFWQ
jgi:hypothetical protein